MAAIDGKVQVAPDSTGKVIDNSELTRVDATVVERQRVNLSDPEDVNVHMSIRGEQQRSAAQVGSTELTEAIVAMHGTLIELLELMQEFVLS
jgi:hypothetical protein